MSKRLLIAIAIVFAACGTPQQAARTTPTASPASDLEAAPDFTLQTLDGDTFTLSEHTGELPIVLNFWAPW